MTKNLFDKNAPRSHKFLTNKLLFKQKHKQLINDLILGPWFILRPTPTAFKHVHNEGATTKRRSGNRRQKKHYSECLVKRLYKT